MSKMYTVEIKECEDESGDAYIDFPPEIFKGLGWEEGDDLKFLPNKDGSFTIKKVKMETIELDFDDDELLKYMQAAHERGITFNQFVENVLMERLNENEAER